MTPTFDDANDAVEHLVVMSRQGQLPFAFSLIGPRDERVDIALTRVEEAAARAFFEDHPLALPDGTAIPVDLEVTASASWTSWPVGGAFDEPDRAALEGLVGVNVNEAALRANGASWLVRAHEPQALLSADMRTNRVNLCFSESGVVTSVRVG